MELIVSFVSVKRAVPRRVYIRRATSSHLKRRAIPVARELIITPGDLGM